MRKLLSSFLLLASFPSYGVAQQPQKGPPPKLEQPAQISWVIRGIQPPYKNILFLVDTSGSMSGRKVEHAIKAAMNISETPIDDLQIAIVSFGSYVYRWEGTADINPKTKKPLSMKGWSLMPSKENLDKAYQWLHSNKQDSCTFILPAMQHAFNSCIGKPTEPCSAPIKKLSIIIISDGEFFGTYDELKQLIKNKQKERKRKNLPAATIGFLGVDVSDSHDNRIKKLIGKRIVSNKKGVKDKWKIDLCILGYCKIKINFQQPD